MRCAGRTVQNLKMTKTLYFDHDENVSVFEHRSLEIGQTLAKYFQKVPKANAKSRDLPLVVPLQAA
jgi:hypothetical protein